MTTLSILHEPVGGNLLNFMFRWEEIIENDCGHYPGHFGEFSGFSKMNFYTTAHSITTNVTDLERTRQGASNGTPMSTLKMKLQGIMTLQTYEKNSDQKW